MMRHAAALRSVRFSSSSEKTIIILFIWYKQTMHFQPAPSAQKHVSIHLSCSVHLCSPFVSERHTHTHTLQYAIGQCRVENAICTRTIRSTLAAVHTMPCLFITAWHMAMKVIVFTDATPTPNSSAYPHRSLPPPHHSTFGNCEIFYSFSLCQGDGWVLL